MNKQIRRNIIRSLIVLAIQLILLKRIDITFSGFNYIHFTIYPIIIALLPYRMDKTFVVLAGFLVGLTVDLFYDSLGVHAATATFTAYARYYILALVAPAEGYGKEGLTAYSYGFVWFVTYLGLLLFIHLLILYSIEAFSFVYLNEIILRTIFSFIASFFLLVLAQLIFNPRY